MKRSYKFYNVTYNRKDDDQEVTVKLRATSRDNVFDLTYKKNKDVDFIVDIVEL